MTKDGNDSSINNDDNENKNKPSSPSSTESRYSECSSRTWMRIPEPLERARLRVGEWINDTRFQTFIVSLIAINGIMLGIATYDFVKDDRTTSHIMETFDLVCLIIFTIELGMQFLYWGYKLFQSGWLVFDLIIITASWGFAQFRIIRAFRIFRALRLVTRIQTMRSLVLGTSKRGTNIKKIIHGSFTHSLTHLRASIYIALFSVMPRMVAIGLLLFLISYIFAVMFTQLFKDLSLEEPYFVRIDNTFFTLFQIMTLDNWSEVVRQVMEYYTWAWFPFITFVIISGFIVVNLIIAVICDAIAALHDDERAKIMGTSHTSSTVTFENEDENTGGGDPQSPTATSVQQQLNALEQSIDKLALIQDQTARTMELFLQRMELEKNNSKISRKNQISK